MEKKTTVEVQIGWIEGLLEIKDRIDLNKIPASQFYPFAQLIGYIESARHILSTPVSEKEPQRPYYPSGTTIPYEPKKDSVEEDWAAQQKQPDPNALYQQQNR